MLVVPAFLQISSGRYPEGGLCKKSRWISVCLPVCLSAAEEVPTGSDSLLLAVLEEELW